MSRCFPYPPPGSALMSSRKEALIESIKFQKEKLKAEELRKDRKREKKEKRKEKKHKKIRNKDKSGVVDGHIGEKFWSDEAVVFPHKGDSYESEQLERSSLTEEHAKPVGLRVPSSSSDSTENSNKRKRLPSPVDFNRGHGNVIRIRLSSKKQSPPNASLDDQKHCSTSSRTQFPIETVKDTALGQRSEGICSTSGSQTSNVGKCLVHKMDGEQIHFSKQIETAPVMTPMQKEGLLYESLMGNWALPGIDTADEDWLFGSKNRVNRSEKKSCRYDSTSNCSSSSLWSRATYLPEVDIHALPYTLPF